MAINRVTFGLSPRAEDALDDLSAEWRENKTSTINHALVRMQKINRLLDDDGTLAIVRPDGSVERIHLI